MKKIETINKYLYLARELKKLWIMRVTVIPVVVGALGRLGKETGGMGGQRKDQNHQDDGINKIN